MARKAVQGYPEKSLYDNSRYLGMIATTDALAEGVFRLLVNFDISDTGKSITPRKGFLTTGLKDISVSTRSIVFKDNDSHRFIIFDFDVEQGYVVDLSYYALEDNLILVEETVTSVEDMPEGLSDIGHVEYIHDEFGVRQAIFRAKKGNKTVTYGVYYNEKIFFNKINFDQHPSYLPHQRNMASSTSIIPNPMQVQLSNVRPDGFVSDVGLVYVSDAEGRYLVNYGEPGKHYTFTPHIALDKPELVKPETNRWAFSIEIVSTKHNTNDTMYRTPWFDTKTYQPIFDYRTDDIDIEADNPHDRYYKGAQRVITLVKKTVRPGLPTFGMFPTIGREELFIKGTTENNLIDPYKQAVEEEQELKRRIELIETTEDMIDFIHYAEGIDYGFVLGNVTEGNSLPGDVGPSSFRTINKYNKFKHYSPYSGNAFSEIRNAGFTTDHYINSEDVDVRANYSWLPSIETPITPSENHLDSVVYKTSYEGVTLLTSASLVNIIEAGAFRLLGEYSRYLFRIFSIRAKGIQYVRLGSNPQVLYGYVYANSEYFRGMRAYSNVSGTLNIISLVLKTYSYITPVNIKSLIRPNRIGISTEQLEFLKDRGYFATGYHVRFYFQPYDSVNIPEKFSKLLLLNEEMYVSAGALYTTAANITYPNDIRDVTYIEKYVTQYVKSITTSKDYIVIEDNQYVVWSGNKLFISEPDRPYYFLEDNIFTFDERIVKVIYFRTLLLVFTTQHLYAVFRQELQMAEDHALIVWSKQRVLYNILVDDQYKDAIQVFNQMILFYSSDGQLYLIKPSTQIDNETRFNLQFLNKGANDLLANYDKYIEERLRYYNVTHTFNKEDVKITVHASINYIKIYYTVEGAITLILLFDVINNRFLLYDSLSFTNICDKMFIDSGELLVNHEHGQLLFTLPQAQHYDQHYLRNFRKDAIHAMIDTGNIELNNHLRKRFKDLRVIFKNIDAREIEYKVEHSIDEIVIDPAYDHTLEVRTIDGRQTYVEELVERKSELLENGTLFDFSTYMSNSILSHRTYVLGVGKVLRLKLMFASHGRYKIQGHSITFKERRI